MTVTAISSLPSDRLATAGTASASFYRRAVRRRLTPCDCPDHVLRAGFSPGE